MLNPLDKGQGDKNDILKDLLEQLKQDDSVMRAKLNDQRLMVLAEYDATHGYMQPLASPELLQQKFIDLKSRVKCGSFTLKTLEDDIFNKYGIQEESRDEALRNVKGSDTPEMETIGFNLTALEVADIPEDSPENR